MVSNQKDEISSFAQSIRTRKPVRGSLVWWLRFLGVIAFVVILLRLPRSQQIQLLQIDLRWIGFAMLLTVLQVLSSALIWQWLLSAQHIAHTYAKTILAYFASRYLGLVTPGHVGEFLAAGYISMNTGITFGYALSSVVMEKALYWIVLIGFGIWGFQLIAGVSFLHGVKWALIATAIVVLVLSVGIWLWVVSIRRLARKWQRLSPWTIDMTEFRAGLRKLSSLRLIGPLMLACLSFSLLFFQLDAVLHALGVPLPLIVVSQVVAFSRIVGRIVPISVVGFGSKDAAVIGLLAQNGIDPVVGLTATVVWLLCSYLVTLVLSGISWWIKPLVVKRVAPIVS